jgi:nucleotide-binding universal stress UspA family protein
MAEINRILIPVDFSDVSQTALNYGISIATVFNADLVVASVIEDDPAFVPGSEGSTPERRQAYAQAETGLAALVPDRIPGTSNCDCLVKAGDIEDELLAAVTDRRVDLVIMGTHGRRAFKRWFLGSVTERFLRRVSVPVITLSHLESDIEAAPFAKDRLLYATDLSYGSEHGLNLAYAFANRFRAGLTVLHVIPPWSGILSGQSERDHARSRERLMKRLENSIPEPHRTDTKVRWGLREGKPYETILKVADEEDVGLIVVNLHGEHRTQQPLIGSTAERVIRGAHRPVLSVPEVTA